MPSTSKRPLNPARVHAQAVRNIARDAFQDALEIRLIVETIEACPASVFIKQTAAGNPRVMQCLHRHLWRGLITIVARAYAQPTRLGDLHAQRAFDLLKDPAIRCEVAKAHQADNDILAGALAAWESCCGNHRLKWYRTVRNKQIAHLSDMTQVKQHSVLDKDKILGFALATAGALEKLAQGTGAIPMSIDSQLTNYREEAERFWQGDTR